MYIYILSVRIVFLCFPENFRNFCSLILTPLWYKWNPLQMKIISNYKTCGPVALNFDFLFVGSSPAGLYVSLNSFYIFSTKLTLVSNILGNVLRMIWISANLHGFKHNFWLIGIFVILFLKLSGIFVFVILFPCSQKFAVLIFACKCKCKRNQNYKSKEVTPMGPTYIF